MKENIFYRPCKMCGKPNPGKKNYCGKVDEEDTCANKHQREYSRQTFLKNKAKYKKPKKDRDTQIYTMAHLNQY